MKKDQEKQAERREIWEERIEGLELSNSHQTLHQKWNFTDTCTNQITKIKDL